MKITIIGAGNTGYAAAAYFSNLKHDVTLYTRSSAKAKEIEKVGIKSINKIEGIFDIRATCNIEEAVVDADYLMIFTKANHHSDVFEKLKGGLEKNQKILIFNGNWGAYECLTILGDEISEKGLYIGEVSSMPFIANSNKIGHVEILGIKEHIDISLYPGSLNKKSFMEGIRLFFNNVSIRKSILETTLMSTNPYIHVPIVLFNIVRIENGHDFKFYGEGTSDKCIEYIENIDSERQLIGSLLGLELPSILDSINSFWEIKYENLIDALKNNYPTSKAPKFLEHRYIEEDIPYGLVPVAKLGRKLGVDTPYLEKLISVMSLYTNKDFENDSVIIDMNKIKELIGRNIELS